MNCVYCRRNTETREHMLFQCTFTGRIWEGIMKCFLIENPEFGYCRLVDWGAESLKGKILKSIVVKTA